MTENGDLPTMSDIVRLGPVSHGCGNNIDFKDDGGAVIFNHVAVELDAEELENLRRILNERHSGTFNTES